MATTAASAAHLDESAVANLCVVVSELATNAYLHGVGPFTVEPWSNEDSVDLRVAHQLCAEIDLVPRPTGFAVRATVRNEP